MFLIGVVEHPHAELRYVYCKGIRYPPVASRLVPLVVPWNIPFCNAVHSCLVSLFDLFFVVILFNGYAATGTHRLEVMSVMRLIRRIDWKLGFWWVYDGEKGGRGSCETTNRYTK